MKVVTVIQARSGSSRLPDKVLLPLVGEPLLLRMIERVQASKLKGQIVVATTQEPEDQVIENLCKKHSITCFRGDRNDLLDRHYQAAKMFDAEAVVKIPSDCPLIDPQVIDRVLTYFLAHDFDYVGNLHPATYPDGNDVEVMTWDCIQRAWKEAQKPMEREHTTPYIWEHPDRFRCGSVRWETGLDYSMTHRWTIDYREDYEFIRTVYDYLYPQNPQFTLQDVLQLTDSHPEILAINAQYAGVNWYRHHLHELKTIDATQTKMKA